MARPTKWRRIEHVPTVSYFAASEEPTSPMPCNELKLEELEALRLKDLEGLEQEDCALKMDVSRPTFQRILLSARKKTADSLCSGKAIRIGGGCYACGSCPALCLECGREWTESCEEGGSERAEKGVCPSCSSHRVRFGAEKNRACRGECHRHGRPEK